MNNKIKKIIAVYFLATFLIFSSPLKVSAYVAWPDIGGAFFNAMLTKLWTEVQAAAIGALKKAAIDTLSETVNNLVSGATQAGALFITDWEDYLFSSPSGTTNTYMNDFFTVTTRGRSSGSYTSGACGGSFSEWRSERAKQVNVTFDYTELQDDFQEYACDALNMFDDGTWAAYNAFMQPNNNPIAYALITESVYEKKLKEEQTKAAAKATAYGGFIASQDENGYVITPGSIIQGITLAANTMDNDAIANADHIGEVAGIVVGKIASGIIKKGIGNARQNIQNKINENICDASQDLRDSLKNLTPSGNLLGSGLGTTGSNSSSTCTVQ